MRVCIISTTVMCLPPKGYSGLEQLAFQQAEGLSKKGHKVLLIAPIGSIPPTNVELHGTTLGESEKQAYSGYWQRLTDFDVIIDNSWEKWSYMLKIEGKLKQPILGVIHAPADTMYKEAPPVEKPCFVAISKDQTQAAEKCWKINVRTAYNGVDLDFYKPTQIQKTERYLFLARISSIKGPQIALEIAKKLGFGLDIVGDDKITGEPELAKKIREQSVGPIIYHGGVTRDRAVEFFNAGKALLHMNKLFKEPFGLAPVEAQACGTPCIAFRNGAMPETIYHGETGFLVKSEEEVYELIKSHAVETIKPERCREWASQFSIQNMIDRYDALITEAIDSGGW